MEIGNTKIELKIKMYSNPDRQDIKAYLSLRFNDLLSVNGFTVRESKHNTDKAEMTKERYWVAKPISARRFPYFEMLDDSAWKQIEGWIIDEFIDQKIPVIDG